MLTPDEAVANEAHAIWSDLAPAMGLIYYREDMT
jgi:hypothetical protein